MLKRLLIAVFVLGLILTLSGTAFSGQTKGDLNPILKVDPSNPRFNSIKDARPEQPSFKKPESARMEATLPAGGVPSPTASYFCDLDYYYDDTATAVYYWTIPDSYGDDLFNTRFTVEEGLEECTLKVGWILMLGNFMVGTPDMRIYLWDDDGFGFPGNKLDSADVPYASLPASFGYVGADFSSANWVFTEYQEYHLGWTILQNDPGDVLCCVSDKATGPHVGEERSSENYGAWGSMLNDWGIDVTFMMEMERCCWSLAFSECDWNFFYTNASYYWEAPHPVYGDTAYAEYFDLLGPETLIYLDFYVFDDGTGNFGDDDIYITIYDDAGGVPGSAITSKTISAGTYPAFPAWTSIDFSADNLVLEDDFYVSFSTNGTGGNYEAIMSDDGTSGGYRSYSNWTGTWTQMLTGWGLDVDFMFDLYMCKDEYQLCTVGPDCNQGLGYFWYLPDSYGDVANAQFRKAGGIECRVEEVTWMLYNRRVSGVPDPDQYTDSSRISLYTNAFGLPGTEIAGITLQPADYGYDPLVAAWPMTVDFEPLEVFVSQDYWIVIESYAATQGEGIRTLTDAGGGGCADQSAEMYYDGGQVWESMAVWGIPDLAFVTESRHCCIPIPAKVCAPPSDWATLNGNYTRNGNSETALDDAWCDMTLNWHYEHPALGVGLSATPIIYGDYVVQSWTGASTTEFKKFNLLTGVEEYTVSTATHDQLGNNVRCSPTIETIDIGGTPTEVMFVSGGNTQAIYCLDFSDGSVIWSRDIYTVGIGGLFGETRYGTFTVLDIAGTEVVFWATSVGNIVAAVAETGALYTGWTTNPVVLGSGVFKAGATDGTQLYFSTIPAAGNGDVFALDAATGAINWQLSTAGLKGAIVYGGLAVSVETFRSGVSYAPPLKLGEPAQVFAHSGVNGNHPADGVFYRINAADGSVLSAARAVQGNYSTPVVDKARAFAIGRSRWATPPLGGQLNAFSTVTGALEWVGDHWRSPGEGYYSEGLMTCEPDALPDQTPEMIVTFGDEGTLQFTNAWTGEEYFHRRVDHGAFPNSIGLGVALGANGYLAACTYWGDLFILNKGVDRARLNILEYTPRTGVNFGTGLLDVDFGPVLTNTGCANLTFTSVTAEDAPSALFRTTNSNTVSFAERMERGFDLADQMLDDKFSKLTQRSAVELDEMTSVRDENYRDERVNRAASATPAWVAGIVHPSTADVVAPDEILNLVISVSLDNITRGPNNAWIALETNDPDFWLNDPTRPAEIQAVLVGGCLTDTATLFFGAGDANSIVVYNSGRLGDISSGAVSMGGWTIDGVNSVYFGGGYIYGVEQYRIAMSLPSWTSGAGPTEVLVSLQADPNLFDGACAPSCESAVDLGFYTDGTTHTPIVGNRCHRSFLDSVQNFDDGSGWDWEWWDAPFDNALTMGLKADTRFIGITDGDATGLGFPINNFAIDILDFAERNGNPVPDWRLGEIADLDIGSNDTIVADRGNSVGYAYSVGDVGVWGSIKIPFGPGYEPLIGVVNIDADQGLWDWAAYFDSAYYHMGRVNTQGQNVTSDFEAQFNYAWHDFAGGDDYSIGIVHFGMPAVDANGGTPAELVALANWVNKWAGFGRGDVDNDGNYTLADIIYLASYVNGAGDEPVPFVYTGDVNDDGVVDALDVNFMVDFYFSGGSCPMGDWEI